MSRFSEAIHGHALHHAFFVKLSSSIDPKTVQQWKELVMAWEADQTKACPFEDVKNSMFNLCEDKYKVSS